MRPVYTRSLPVTFLKRFSRQRRKAPWPNRGIGASAMNCRSMLQARMGRWGRGALVSESSGLRRHESSSNLAAF